MLQYSVQKFETIYKDTYFVPAPEETDDPETENIDAKPYLII